MVHFIVNVKPYGCDVLQECDTYEIADKNINHFFDLYPHAYIDIFNEKELNEMKGGDTSWVRFFISGVD